MTKGLQENWTKEKRRYIMYDNDKKNNNNTGLIHFSQLMALRSLSVKRPATDHKLPQNNVVDDSIN